MMKTGTGIQESGIGKAATSALLAALLLTGCSILSSGERTPTTLYAPDPRVSADPGWPMADWQLSLSEPSAARMIDSSRIAVRPGADEIQVYKGAAWAKRPGDMLEDTIARALEDSGHIRAVAREGSGVAADYKLVLDIRRFEADYAGNAMPTATIEVNAKLLHTTDQDIVGSRTFRHAEPSASADIADVVDAFSRSLEDVSRDVAGWILVTGDAHERGGHPAEAASPARR